MTMNVGWNGVVVPGTAVGSAVAPTPADPALVQRFNEAMAPQSATQSAPADPALATDAQLNRLPPYQLAQLQARYGDDIEGLRRHGKVMLDLIEKPIQQSIMKQIRKGFNHKDD